MCRQKAVSIKVLRPCLASALQGVNKVLSCGAGCSRLVSASLELQQTIVRSAAIVSHQMKSRSNAARHTAGSYSTLVCRGNILWAMQISGCKSLYKGTGGTGKP